MSLPPGCRMPAETEPHRRTLLAWPPDVPQCIYTPDHLAAARDAYAHLARAVAAYEPVTVVARPDDLAGAAAAAGPGVDVVALPLDDAWIRDTGPIGVRAPGGDVHAVHFGFNAWGDKQQPYGSDAAVGGEVARRLGLPVHEAPFVLEGGSVAVDGRGTLVTTERCLLNPNRGPGRTRAVMERALHAWLGAERVVWLADAIAEDVGTDGHVDNVVAFTPSGSVLLQGCDDPANPNAAIAAANASRLRDAGLDVVEVPVLPYAHLDVGDRPAPYVNLYAGNGFVAVPVCGDPFDDEACGLLGASYPGRDVLAVPASLFAWGGGGVHCVTQQVPA